MTERAGSEGPGPGGWWRSHGVAPWVIGLFLLAFAVRAGWIAYVNPDPLEGGFWTRGAADTVFYYGAARSLADGDGYKNPWTGEATHLYPPGYPLALASAFLLFGKSLIVAKVFNCLLGAATVVLVYLLAARVGNRRVGMAAGIMMAVFPGQVFFSTVLLTETLFTAVATGLLLAVVAWTVDRHPSRWQLLVLGLLVGFLSLVRAEAVLLVPALAVLWKFLAPSWQQLARWLAFLVIGAGLVVTPWAVRNYVRFGEFDLRQGSVRTLRMGLSPDFEERNLKEIFLRIDQPSFGDLGRHYLAHPWDVGAVTGRKLAALYRDDAYAFTWIQGNHVPPPLSSGEVSRWSLLADTYYYAVGALAVLGTVAWLVAPNRRRAVMLWFLGSWSFIQLPFLPESRYHFSAVPTLSVLAAVAIVGGWEAAKGRLARRPPASVATEAKTILSVRRLPGGWLAPALPFLLLVALTAAYIIKGPVDLEARLRDVRRQADLAQLAQALSSYAVRFGGFPTTGGLDRMQTLCASATDAGCALKGSALNVPSDPLGHPDQNGYWYASDGRTAILYARREIGEPWSGPPCPSTPPQLVAYGKVQCRLLSPQPSAAGG